MDIHRGFPQYIRLPQSEISELKKRIEKLNWNEYIVYDGIKWGIPNIYENKHREHDCNGDIIIKRIFCECNRCESGWGICDNYIKLYSKCSKCDFEKYE
jgi:hypothetical protein